MNVDGVMALHTVVSIIGDSACFFRWLSFLMNDTLKRCTEIRERIVTFAVENWNSFAIFSYDANSNNFISSEEYMHEMSQHSVYTEYCELVEQLEFFFYYLICIVIKNFTQNSI